MLSAYVACWASMDRSACLTVKHQQHQGHPQGWTRNSPSRKCHRIRWSSAREKEAKEAAIQAEKESAEANENEMNQNDREEATKHSEVAEKIEQVADEFCPNSKYDKDETGE